MLASAYRLCFAAAVISTGLLSTSALLAEDGLPAEGLLPADSALPVVIDHYVDQQNQKGGIPVVGQATDYVLLRRMTLDLAGRIPTAAEQTWYATLCEGERTTLLVDRLMNLPDFNLHLRDVLDEMLLANRPFNNEFRTYLLWALEQNRPWHQMFRDMLTAADSEGPEKGAAEFLKTRARQLDDLTNDTAILFFGVNISCAKCHDHPLVADWKQDHFYGMQAFFSRTFPTKKNTLTEKHFGEVKFRTTGGAEKTAAMMFLTGAVVEDRTPSFTDEERKQLEEAVRKLEREDQPPEYTAPTFSPRLSLIDAALSDTEGMFLARNIVNRTWGRLTGTGLVDPGDQMHSANPASHPELLSWLARDLITHEYDLRRLVRGIVLSNTYARSSEWTSTEAPPAAQTFAVAKTRALTPRQLAASLTVAIQHPDRWPVVDPAAENTASEWAARRKQLDDQANGLVREFEQPFDGFQVAVDEALFFSNSERLQNELLKDSDDRILGYLKSIEDNTKAVNVLWKNILNRDPDADEIQMAQDWLGRSGNDHNHALQQLAWALLSGAEMRFNH